MLARLDISFILQLFDLSLDICRGNIPGSQEIIFFELSLPSKIVPKISDVTACVCTI